MQSLEGGGGGRELRARDKGAAILLACAAQNLQARPGARKVTGGRFPCIKRLGVGKNVIPGRDGVGFIN